MPTKSLQSAKSRTARDRLDFPPKVVKAIRNRAGGRCSIPRCKNPTAGPFVNKTGAVNIGTACHIYSAKQKGPRGWHGQSKEFIRSEANGLWCCVQHGQLIDKADGIDYPPEVLLSWKTLAEARAKKQLDDTPSPLGWIDSIEVTEFPLGKPLPKITLSRWTLLWSSHSGSGRTILFESVAAISHSRHASRFTSPSPQEQIVVGARMVYSTVDSLSKELTLRVRGEGIVRYEQTSPFILPPGDVEVILCSDRDLRRRRSEDDIDFFMRILDIDRSALLTLASIGASSVIPGSISFEQVEVVDEETGKRIPLKKSNGDLHYDLHFQKTHRDFSVPYELLSTSEQGRLVLDLQISKARLVCKQRLTLLLIDSLASGFDEGNFSKLLIVLQKEDFQVVASIPRSCEEAIVQHSHGRAKLVGKDFLEGWRLAVIGEDSK